MTQSKPIETLEQLESIAKGSNPLSEAEARALIATAGQCLKFVEGMKKIMPPAEAQALEAQAAVIRRAMEDAKAILAGTMVDGTAHEAEQKSLPAGGTQEVQS